MDEGEREAMRLVLEDGTVFEGRRLGVLGEAVGEVVFNTAMTGHQEMFTDPSYCGQILVPTYPMIGNYGFNSDAWESDGVHVGGVAVLEHCDLPSHPEAETTVDEWLTKQGVPGVAGVETRVVARKLRTEGVMMGMVTPREDVDEAVEVLRSQPRYEAMELVSRVSTREAYGWDGRGRVDPDGTQEDSAGGDAAGGGRIVVLDCGVKRSLLGCLERRGCEVIVVPYDTGAEGVLGYGPDALVISSGPGNPVLLDGPVETVRSLAGKVAVFGMGLGHLVIARAFGAETFKLKYGHRGGNHSIREVGTGAADVAAQNSGYAVSLVDLPAELEVTYMDQSDNTIEGLRHRTLPIMSVQFASMQRAREVSSSAPDDEYVFDRFLCMVEDAKGAKVVGRNGMEGVSQ